MRSSERMNSPYGIDWGQCAPSARATRQAGKTGQVKIIAFDAEPETQRLLQEGVVQVMIGQRVYFYGYLSGYTMYAGSVLGKEELLAIPPRTWTARTSSA